jgi:hypothetical protein
MIYQTQSTAPQDEHHTTKDSHGIQCIIIKAIEEDIATTTELSSSLGTTALCEPWPPVLDASTGL